MFPDRICVIRNVTQYYIISHTLRMTMISNDYLVYLCTITTIIHY